MIERPPTFFIPGFPEDQHEAIYHEMARAGNTAATDERVYSIRFSHDGIMWTATVGERLKGTKTVAKKGRETVQQHSDDATVLAIFPGNPYIVATSRHPFGTDRSLWENPFMAGEPRSVTLFRKG